MIKNTLNQLFKDWFFLVQKIILLTTQRSHLIHLQEIIWSGKVRNTVVFSLNKNFAQ